MIQLTEKWINTNFDILNEKIFNSFYGCKLPKPKFVVSRAKNTLGLFHYLKMDHTGYSYVIKISKYYNRSEKELIDTLCHEMIHEYIQYNNIHDNNAHGTEFCRMMGEINCNYDMHMSVRSNISNVAISNDYSKPTKLIVFHTSKDNKFIVRSTSYRIQTQIINNFRKYGEIYTVYSLSKRALMMNNCNKRLLGFKLTNDIEEKILSDCFGKQVLVRA